MILEVVYVMLVSVCIGVIYLIVFVGFLFDVFVNWINDFEVKVVIIVDIVFCGGCCIVFKFNVDVVLLYCLDEVKCFVVKYIGD